MDVHALKVLEFPRVLDLVATRCQSAAGQRVARDATPYTDAAVLQTVLRQTDEARALRDGGHPLPVGGVDDVDFILRRAHDDKHPIEPADFVRVHKTLSRARELRGFVLERKAAAAALADLADQFLDHGALLAEIDAVIEAPGAIQDRASERLWEIRRAIRKVEDDVRACLHELLKSARIQNAVQNAAFTLRNGRYVLPVKLEMKGHVRGILHDMSRAGSTAFIEPAEVVPLTNRLRELSSDQAAEETRILWELTRTTLASANAVRHTLNLLAWFDFTAAKALLSAEFSMTSPELAADGRFRLIGARHPLLLAAAEGRPIVPIDVRLREHFRILVITGPNTGGKTVTLKTCGLIQIMFQSGLHVPAAAGSVLPVFRSLFADIGDEQSIDQNLSTFSGHVRNLAEILKHAGRGTLVLLDELGAGTDPTEGAALATAVLDELRERRSAVIVTTHIGSLKQYAYAHPEVENASVEFDVETMSPTYRLLIGQPGNSNALHIARKWGIDEAIVHRAESLIEGETQRTSEFIEQLQESRRAVEDVKRQTEAHLERSRNLQRAAEEKLRHVEKKEVRAGQEAESLIDDVLKRILADVEGPLRELQNVPAPLKPAVQSIRGALDAALRDSSLGRKRREFIETLRREDKVYVPRFGSLGRVRKINKADETLTLVIGAMTVEVPYDDVSWLTPPPDSP